MHVLLPDSTCHFDAELILVVTDVVGRPGARKNDSGYALVLNELHAELLRH
ncbi:MAG: hypothetical protein KDA87_19270 [Planctomycetales bacterium]|nr:hypothetical protein [Planctomycetales bacterium]